MCPKLLRPLPQLHPSSYLEHVGVIHDSLSVIPQSIYQGIRLSQCLKCIQSLLIASTATLLSHHLVSLELLPELLSLSPGFYASTFPHLFLLSKAE